MYRLSLGKPMRLVLMSSGFPNAARVVKIWCSPDFYIIFLLRVQKIEKNHK